MEGIKNIKVNRANDSSKMNGMMGMMMGSFQETAASAKFATPEVRSLFEEWSSQSENAAFIHSLKTAAAPFVLRGKKFTDKNDSAVFHFNGCESFPLGNIVR